MTGTNATKWHRDGALHFALGIENTFVPQSSPTERALDEYELTEHYANWRGDLDRASLAGAELLRWGIPWHRVQPRPDRWDWSWVDSVVDHFCEIGLRPVIDLLHYGTPTWLEGEFASSDFAARFADFGVAVAERYGDRVTDYTPVNEPMIHALFSGEYGYWPPYLTGTQGLATMSIQLADAFHRAQNGITDVLGDRALFVHVDAGMRYVGADDEAERGALAERLRQQVWLVEDLVTGAVDDRHALWGALAQAGITDALLERLRARPALPDVAGVNYYPRHSTEVLQTGVHHGGGFADPRPTRDDGTAGLEELLRQAHARFTVPVAVTETCVTGTVDERAQWMDESIDCVARLRAEGLPVVAYTWWPVFDMYEWTWRHSAAPRAEHLLTMGLWSLAESTDGLARVETPLVDRFRRHAADPRHRPIA